MQSRVTTLARDFFHPLQTTHTFTAELPAAKVVHLMSSDAATSADALLNPLGKGSTDADNKAGVLVTAGSEHAYFITVHDVFRDRAQAHPDAVSTLQHWQLHFMETPIFAEVNFRQTKYTFPDLVAPTRTDAWTTTRIIVGPKLFHIFVTFAPIVPPHRATATTDRVVLYLQSPPLAQTGDEQQQPPSSSDEARTVAVHNGLFALGLLGYSFHDCTHAQHQPAAAAAAAPDEAALSLSIVLHGDRTGGGQRTTPRVVWAGFASPQTEQIAGQHVLPLALQYARFLLPAMAAGERILYDIIQPHPLAYLFQIRTLGGWTLTGAVNLHATLDAIQPHFRLRGLSPSEEEEAGVASLTVPIAALARSQLRARAAQIHASIKHGYTVDFDAWILGEATRDQKRPFKIAGGGLYLNSVDHPFTREQLRIVGSNPQLWALIQANAGLQILLGALHPPPLLQSTSSTALWRMHQGDLYAPESMVLLGNTFIDLFAAAHSSALLAAGSPRDSYYYRGCTTAAEDEEEGGLSAVQAATNGTWVVSVLFRVLCSLLEGLTDSFKNAATAKIGARGIRQFKNKCLPVGRIAPLFAQSMTTMPVFTPQSVLGQLNLCRGLPPSDWGVYLVNLFHSDPGRHAELADIFIQALWVRPAPYSGLLEPALRRLIGAQTRIPAAEVGATLAQLTATAAEMDPELKAAYSAGFWFSKPYAANKADKKTHLLNTDGWTDHAKLSKALAYMLLTADVDTFNTAQWSPPFAP